MILTKKMLLALTFFCLVFTSCKKQTPGCSGNCTDVVFAGHVYDKSLNTPLANQTISVILSRSGYCLVCSSTKLASGKTNSAGYFSLTGRLDTSLMGEYKLQVAATAPENYLTSAQPVGPGILVNKDNVVSVQFSKIDPVIFNNLRFDFYPRALLKINLHRTSAAVQAYPHLSQSYVFDDRTSVWGLTERSTNADTSLTIYTTANIFTKIVSTKQLSPSIVNRSTDSILCSATTTNSINVTY